MTDKKDNNKFSKSGLKTSLSYAEQRALSNPLINRRRLAALIKASKESELKATLKPKKPE